jgi:hypothetical protein
MAGSGRLWFMIGLLVVLVALGVWLVFQPRILPQQPAPAVDEQTAEKATSSPVAPLLPISCPGCGKKLKVKPALVGKKVKCPACRVTVVVPETAFRAADSAGQDG